MIRSVFPLLLQHIKNNCKQRWARFKLLQLSLLQSGDEDDSESLELVLKDLRDSEAKLVSMLGGETPPDDKNGETEEEETIKVKGVLCVAVVS